MISLLLSSDFNVIAFPSSPMSKLFIFWLTPFGGASDRLFEKDSCAIAILGETVKDIATNFVLF